MTYETVIGLEVHLQLNTNSKIFCGCANDFGREPNSLTCPVCLGLPGTLPVLNKKALDYGIKIALALNCQINPLIKFDRKNYFYPDLPKGYQISQFDLPIAANGWIDIHTDGKSQRIRIKRAHLEEDAGKLIHEAGANASLVDYNRTGTPLVEIVTEPDLCSAQEAYDYLTTLKLILQYLHVSDCDMEKGSLRCDANISIRAQGESKLGTKTELKNMNSFRAVKTALEFEISRHKKVIDFGNKIIQETRLWNEDKAMTIAMRSKEEAHDYRYFPEPDLVPFLVEVEEIEHIRASLPEMPQEKLTRLIQNYQLSEYDAQIIIQDPAIADFFETCNQLLKEAKKISNWLIGPILSELNLRKVDLKGLGLKPEELVGLIQKIDTGVLSNLAAKDVLKKRLDTNKKIEDIISDEGLTQVSDDATLEKIVTEVIEENPPVVEQIKQGKENAMGFLVGCAMKKTQGKANPKKIGDLLKRRLQNV